MQQASKQTVEKSSVVVQKTKICTYGETRYKLASALAGADGFDLDDDFKNAVRLLPSTYSVNDYVEFLDDWGTVSACHKKQLHYYYWYNICVVVHPI